MCIQNLCGIYIHNINNNILHYVLCISAYTLLMLLFIFFFLFFLFVASDSLFPFSFFALLFFPRCVGCAAALAIYIHISYTATQTILYVFEKRNPHFLQRRRAAAYCESSNTNAIFGVDDIQVGVSVLFCFFF